MDTPKGQSALVIVWEFPPGPGGIGQHAYSLAVALMRKGLEVDVVTSADYANKTTIERFDLDNNRLNIHRVVGKRPFLHVLRLVAVVRHVVRMKPSMVFLSGKGALWYSFASRAFLSKDSVVYGFVHGSEVRQSNLFAMHLTKLSMRFTDELICVSEFTKRLLEQNVKGLRSISVLVNGLSVALMPSGQPTPLDVIRRKGYPRLLTVGRISPRKGQQRVVKALPYLRTFWPDIHYHMVGLDSDKQELIALAKRLGVEGNLTIHGVLANREDLYKAYCAADVFIMLSENQRDGDVEGFGIAILEANYFGVPAIGAKGCGVEDAIRSGTNGYLISANHPEELADAVKKCLSVPSLKIASKEWARMHDWDTLISQIISR